MEGIKKYQNQDNIRIGVSDADPQYKLIVDANNLAMEIDNEVVIIHKYCKLVLFIFMKFNQVK